MKHSIKFDNFIPEISFSKLQIMNYLFVTHMKNSEQTFGDTEFEDGLK